MLKISIEPEQTTESISLSSIPNGTFFMGRFKSGCSSGPFLKVGSLSQNLWIVVRLGAMDGLVWTSTRQHDAADWVDDYRALMISEVVLRERA